MTQQQAVEAELVASILAHLNDKLGSIAVARPSNLSVLGQLTLGGPTRGEIETVVLVRLHDLSGVAPILILVVAEPGPGGWKIRGSTGRSEPAGGPDPARTIRGTALVQLGKRILLGIYNPTTEALTLHVDLDDGSSHVQPFAHGAALAAIPVTAQGRADVQVRDAAGRVISANQYALR